MKSRRRTGTWRRELVVAAVLVALAALLPAPAGGQQAEADKTDDPHSRLERITRGELPLPAATTPDPMAPAVPSAQVDAETRQGAPRRAARVLRLPQQRPRAPAARLHLAAAVFEDHLRHRPAARLLAFFYCYLVYVYPIEELF